MSMNLSLQVRQGRWGEEFPLRQTPSDLTLKVMGLPTFQARLDEYCGWVLSSTSGNRKFKDAHEDSLEHCEDLRAWVKDVQDRGLLPTWGCG